MARKRLFDSLTGAFTSKGAERSNDLSSGTIRALQQENLRLTRALEELSMLNELAREIGASRNSEGIMGRIIKRSLRAVNAEQAVITLVGAQEREPMKTLVRAMVTWHVLHSSEPGSLSWNRLNLPRTCGEWQSQHMTPARAWALDCQSLYCWWWVRGLPLG